MGMVVSRSVEKLTLLSSEYIRSFLSLSLSEETQPFQHHVLYVIYTRARTMHIYTLYDTDDLLPNVPITI